jgi:hypothetical protein
MCFHNHCGFLKKPPVAYLMALLVFLQKAALSNQNGLTVIGWKAQGLALWEHHNRELFYTLANFFKGKYN